MDNRTDGGNLFFRVLLVIFAAVFCLSLFVFLGLLRMQKIEKKKFAELRGQASAVQEEGGDSLEGSAEGQPADPYAELREQNPDFYGWIRIEGTQIDYPVMWTPQEEDYYLHRSFTGEFSYSGVPFMGKGCTEEGHVLLIYGHHMRDGSMFADLEKYRDADFLAQHSRIDFDTLEGPAVYQAVAAFYTSVDSEDGFAFYEYAGEPDEEQFGQLTEAIGSLTGQSLSDVEYGDSLLMLATCSYQTQDGRFVVVAKKVTDN